MPMNIGQIIRELREERGLTQEGLAFEAGVTSSYISRIERGERRIPNTTLESIAGALGSTASYLYSKLEGHIGEFQEPPENSILEKKLGQLRQIARQLCADDLALLIDLAKIIEKRQVHGKS